MQESAEFDGKVAIVTGAGSGLGRAISLRLAQGGAHAVLNDVSLSGAESTVAKIKERGGEAVAVQGDVTRSQDVKRMVDTAVKRYGGVHILVNNAGIIFPTRVFDLEEEEWDRVIEVNLKGTYLCARAVLPAMRKAGWGRIVNMSSKAGRSSSTIGGAHYTASKAAVLGFTRHLAREEAQHGITVNAVCPGLIDTEMVRSTIGIEKALSYAPRFPISRLGQPEEVADLVAFLASKRASYITGASADINGGDLMM
jgi:3-oxoacyl-[acyl-carrier protein] reductase